MTGAHFLHGDAEDTGGNGRKGKFFHLGEIVDARLGADFQCFFGGSPCVGCGEFEGADDVRMLEHEYVRVLGNPSNGDCLWLAKQIANEVKGMDVEVEQSITFWVCSSEVMQVVID